MNIVTRMRSILRGNFARNVAVVAGGTAMAQAISMAFSPVITRLYGPEAFGILGVFMALVGMLAPFATLTYANAIVLPESDADAWSIAAIAIGVAIAFSLLLLGVLLFFGESVTQAIGLDLPREHSLLVPVVVLLTALQYVLTQWLMRRKRFRSISSAGVAQAGILGVSKSLAGMIAPSAPVLVILNALGQAAHCGMLYFAIGHAGRTRGAKVRDHMGRAAASIRSVAYEYRDFPLFRSPQVLLHSVSENLPTIMLATLFTPASAGFYAIARRALQLPGSLVAASVGTVLLPRLAEAGRAGESLRPLVAKATLGLAATGLVPFGLVVGAGPFIFGLVFGPEWVEAGVYARWMALWLFFAFINVPSVQAVPVLGLQGQFLIYGVITLFSRTAALAYGGVVRADPVYALGLFSIVGVVLNVAMIVWVIANSRSGTRRGLSSGVASETS